MNPFTERVIQIIKGIPTGHVMSYGQIAAAAGSPRAARQVVRILHSMSDKYELPWHRVINAQGEISFTGKDQHALLVAEGIIFKANGKVDFGTYRWFPVETWEE
ncbi:MGMT family protein [Sporosarcina sp. CAU 1771]